MGTTDVMALRTVMGRYVTLGMALCAAVICVTAGASPAHAEDRLCRDWKRAIDASVDGFKGLRVSPKDTSNASTFTMYGAEKPCTVRTASNRRGPSYSSLQCELRASEYPIATWDRFTGNLETCITVGPLKGWNWQRYIGGSGPAVRITHPSDPGAVVTTVETVRRSGITYWSVRVAKDERAAAERAGYRGLSVATKPPKGPRKATIKKAVQGKRAKGDCLLLALGRKSADPAVQALLAGLGAPSADGKDAGNERVRTWQKHGVSVRTNSAGVIEVVGFAVTPNGMQAFKGVLPYGIGRKDNDFDWRRKMGEPVRADTDSVYLTDRTLVSPAGTGTGRERRVQSLAVKLRPGWAPYPLTAVCGL